MPPRFLVLSRENAAAYEPVRTEVCISITDPRDLPVALSARFQAVLRLSFSDIGEATRLHRDSDVLFAPEHAARIMDFVRRWADVDQIVIHCTAGISRSPGVGLGICELQGWPVEELQRKHPAWNKWVRKELVRAGRETPPSITSPDLASNDPVRRLSHPSRLWARGEVLNRQSPVPQARGLHAWFFREIPPRVPIENCTVLDGFTLLYVGIAPSRASSATTLRSRIVQHYRGNAAGSTLRLTLGCLLADRLVIELQRAGSTGRLTFGKRGEERLSEWMAANAFVCWVVHAKPWTLERGAVSSLRPPLNLADNEGHQFCSALSRMRSEMRSKASSRSVSSGEPASSLAGKKR